MRLYAVMAFFAGASQLISAALGLREGTPPPGLDPASYRIRPASVVVPSEASWSEAAKDDLVSRVVS